MQFVPQTKEHRESDLSDEKCGSMNCWSPVPGYWVEGIRVGEKKVPLMQPTLCVGDDGCCMGQDELIAMQWYVITVDKIFTVC